MLSDHPEYTANLYLPGLWISKIEKKKDGFEFESESIFLKIACRFRSEFKSIVYFDSQP